MVLRRVKGIDPVTQWIFNITMLIVMIVAATTAWNWSDKELPAFPIAMWVMPDQLHPNETFTVREIYVRRKLCARHIDHGFSQDVDGVIVGEPTYGMYRLPSPDDLLWPVVKGLLTTNFDADVPASIQPGKATYVMSLVWTCWWNPITYIFPYRTRLSYPVTILPEPELPPLPDIEGFIILVPDRDGRLVGGLH